MTQASQKVNVRSLGNEKGFSLLEIIIVLGIIGGLIAVLVGNLGGASQSARKKETSVRVGQLQSNLLRYQADMGRMPSASEGLSALYTNPGNPKWGGPYGSEDDAKDAWGVSFEYTLSAKGPQLTSAGPDGQPGTEDDLVYINGRMVENTQGSEAPAQ